METWDDIYKKQINGLWYPREELVKFVARYIKRRVNINSYIIKYVANRVLDVGCGNGRHVVFFAEQGFKVSGIDISNEAVEIAQAWLQQKGLSADLITGNATDLPYENETFDVIVSDGVLDHVVMKDADNIISEIKRVLVPNGFFFLKLRSVQDCEYGRGTEIEHHTFLLENGYENGMPQHFYDTEEIRKLLEEFVIIDIERVDTLFSESFGIDKAFLLSSGNNIINIDPFSTKTIKYSEWFITCQLLKTQ